MRPPCPPPRPGGELMPCPRRAAVECRLPASSVRLAAQERGDVEVTVVAEVGGRRSGGGRFGDGGAAAQARGKAAAGTEALAAVLDEHAGGAVALARADQLHVRTACLHLELGLVA